jgi:DNA-binding PadR family transcriptional regulator
MKTESYQSNEKQQKEAFDSCACSGKNLSKLVNPMVLAILSREPAHGYALARQIEERFSAAARPNSSSIYRILKDLEDGGFVSVHLEEPSSGPVRKVYEITDLGVKCLNQWAESLRVHRDAIDNLLRLLD